MNQPDLGKKIADLRKAKGLTQEELVDKCNISVRTLQRIESGEVVPRSYTLKTIFAALDYSFYDSSENQPELNHSVPIHWLGQLYKYVFDLFNFKTNTMKKITILSITLTLIIVGLFAMLSDSNAQTTAKVKKAIEESNKNLIHWINVGQIDSALTLYREDACVLPTICGKIEIREMLQSAVDNNYKVTENYTISVSIGDSIAVEKGYNVYQFSGSTFKSKYLTEWHLTKGKWLIVNDIMSNE